jgi:hypothetical protein
VNVLDDPGGFTFPTLSGPTGITFPSPSASPSPSPVAASTSPWSPPSWPSAPAASVFGRRLPAIASSFPAAVAYGGSYLANAARRNFVAPPPLSSLPGVSAQATVPRPKPPPRPSYDISKDPYVLAARAANERRRSMFGSMTARQKRQAIIHSGDVNLAKAQGLSAADVQATQANYDAGNADLARLDQQNKLAHQAIINQLAGRGILFSGETGYQEQQQGRAYGQQTYDLRTSVLDYLQQLADQYQQELESEREGEEQALAAATSNAIAQQAAWDQQWGQYVLGGGF